MVNAEADGGAEDADPPPLPPRPSQILARLNKDVGRRDSRDGRPQARPTTAISSVEIQTLSFPDGSRGTFTTEQAQIAGTPSRSVSRTLRSPGGYASSQLSGFAPLSTHGDAAQDDSMSVMSFAPTARPPVDLASLVAGEFNKKSRAWSMLRSQSASVLPFEQANPRLDDHLEGYENEFDQVPEMLDGGFNDESRLQLWQGKLKQYMILSSAGKPIWSRHGDLALINSSMAIIQTIISFYDGMKNPLRGFNAGDTRFVVSTEGPLYFVAISRLGESDAQLRDQLKALYMQILSTLTLPTLTRIFVNRPSTDLRTPLQGTESLLSSLADSFTRGSPSSMLGALECLKIRKAHRHTITNALLKVQAEKLLYGLVIAGGKLVSVIRPRRHSLHPSDLQLIFNMLFESGGIKAGGGENWIPLCLPAFNNQGFLYMYVSFFDSASSTAANTQAKANGYSRSSDEEIAIILISPDRESFSDLQQMRNKLAQSLVKSGSLAIIQAAVRAGRPRIQAVVPGAQISHFVFKSRANVQFCMSALDSGFTHSSQGDGDAHGTRIQELATRRRLMTLYHQLHAAAHARHSHLKVLHCVQKDAASLAWITPLFELYCIAGPNVSRPVMTQGANKIVQWVKKEEERLFIIGGGVF